MVTDETVVIGRVARPHGIRGHVIVNPDTDFLDERYRAGQVLLVVEAGGSAPVPRQILAVRLNNGRPILQLEGIEAVPDAERIAGAELRVHESALGKLPEGTFHHHELIGCEVRDRGDLLLGRVRTIEGPTERSRLIVQGERGEIQIPMTADICVTIEPAKGRIVVDPPEGLLELNVPSRAG